MIEMSPTTAQALHVIKVSVPSLDAAWEAASDVTRLVDVARQAVQNLKLRLVETEDQIVVKRSRQDLEAMLAKYEQSHGFPTHEVAERLSTGQIEEDEEVRHWLSLGVIHRRLNNS